MANNFTPEKAPFVSNAGEAVWFSTDKPDTRFNEEGVYGGQLKMSAKAAQSLIDKLEEMNDNSFAGNKRSRAKTPLTENDDGTVSLRVKSKNQPDMYDSTGKKMPKAIKLGNGSRIKVSGTFLTYANGPNFGTTAYVNAVQVLELKEYSKNPFGAAEEGGFVYAGNEPANPFGGSDDAEDETDVDAGDADDSDF